MEYVIAAIALLMGAVIGFLVGERKAREKNRTEAQDAEREAAQLLTKARDESQLVLDRAEAEAKELHDKTNKSLEEETRERRQEFARGESRLEAREEKLAAKEANLDKRESNLDKRATTYDNREQDISKREEKLLARETTLKGQEEQVELNLGRARDELTRVAQMTVEEARKQIIDRITAEAKSDAARLIKQIEEEAIAEADRRSKKIIGIAIQRYAGEYVTERTVSVVQLPSDDIKGRIIGREGRNIRALEAATGINLIIDDTPEAVLLSGFDPIRREIARLALERLIADGRIHPGRIEEVVEKAKKEVDQLIKDAGNKAAFELGLHGIHPELLRLIGRLRYRTSYGQNQWSHSIEVGFLCGMMAGELGLNVKIARRAGLLHDIGKTLTHEIEGSHAVIGGDMCKKYGEDPIVVNAVAAHHEDVPPKSVYAHLVMAADALSGARPGARREILETYVQRLEDMERISMSFEGVDKSYAIQAGRELRVIVEHTRVSDEEAHMLSRDIARRIEQELVYPGQVKVCVIRETRAVEYAR